MERKELEKQYGKVYNTNEVSEEFEIVSFMAPFISVVRKSDSKKGWMTFQHMPRFYYDFRESGEWE